MRRPADSNWVLGESLRHRGSLHQEYWRSTAELSNRAFVAVYPSNGWWRTHQHKNVSTCLPLQPHGLNPLPETDVDLYTPIAQQIATQAAVPVPVNTCLADLDRTLTDPVGPLSTKTVGQPLRVESRSSGNGIAAAR